MEGAAHAGWMVLPLEALNDDSKMIGGSDENNLGEDMLSWTTGHWKEDEPDQMNYYD